MDPVLDELRPDAARVANALRNGLGSMPAYKDSLTEAQIQALALYMSRASGALTPRWPPWPAGCLPVFLYGAPIAPG